ncbi:MAG: DUF1749 domain-containing protein [Patescibacteria group bacterium]
MTTQKRDSIIINIHGTADNFYDNDFIWQTAKTLEPLNVSMLSVNNRGSYNLEFYDYGPGARRNSGASVEIFEDSVIDIDAWVKFALSQGYKKIILQGHSLGTEKLVYYMSKGKYRTKINSIILLGFSDSYGTHYKFFKKKTIKLLEEAKTLVRNKKGYQFLTKEWLSHAGVLPQSAEAHLNFFKADSELSKAFPLRQAKDLIMYKNIKVQILGVIGDQEEYTVIPIKEAIDLLKKENKLATIYQIKNSDHNFSGKEKELALIIKKFIGRK